MPTALSKFLSMPKHKDAARYLSLALTGAITVAAAVSHGSDTDRFDLGSMKVMELAADSIESKASAARQSDAAFASVVAFDARPMTADTIEEFLDRNDLEGLTEKLAELGGSPDDVVYSALEQRGDLLKRMADRLGDLAENLKANDTYGAQLSHESLTQAIGEYEEVFLQKRTSAEKVDSVEAVAQKTEALGMVIRVASGFRL